MVLRSKVMMRLGLPNSLGVMVLLSLVAGCGGTGLPGGNTNGNDNGGSAHGLGGGTIALPQSVGRFVVMAGEEKQSKDILPGAQISATASPKLALNSGDISFTSDDSVGGTLLVSVAFGEVSGFDRACAEPVDSYGPFTVTVNGNSQITSVTGEFEVAPTTVSLLTGGSYTVCVTFSSTVAGTVIISAFSVE